MADYLAKPGASVERDATLSAWLGIAVRESAKIASDKHDAMIAWLQDIEESGGSLGDALDRFAELPRVLWDDRQAELFRQVTFAALLRGMYAATSGANRLAKMEARRSENSGAEARRRGDAATEIVVNAGGLFDRLPFVEAINGLAERLSLIKNRGTRGEDFLSLDAANRSRAFTMAWIEDLGVMQNVHDELVASVNDGETFNKFRTRLTDVEQRTGWLGSPAGDWHYRLVYEQNLSMAYTAGRFDQGRRNNLRVVRILPSISEHPRAEHAIYAGQLFRMGPNSTLPPWNFGCQCGWEWVFDWELEALNIAPDTLPELDFNFGDQEFSWNQTAYMDLSIEPGKYTGAVADIAKGEGPMKANTLKIVLNSIDVTSLPRRTLLALWGDNRRFDGGIQMIDDTSARAIVNFFKERKVKLVIDREHQSLGGTYSSPDGTAPAAGWIDGLDVVPNDGLYGLVEWTDWAQDKILKKEYRYLSPTFCVDRETKRILFLDSVGLTNKPAINGFPALLPNAVTTTPVLKENTMTRDELCAALGMDAGANNQEVLAKVEQVLGGEPTVAANAVKLKIVGDAIGLPNLVGQSIELATNSIQSKVAELKSPTTNKILDKALLDLQSATANQKTLEKKIADMEWEGFLQANSNRITPAETNDVRKDWDTNRELTERYIKAKPELVVNSRSASAGGNANGATPDRQLVINSARQGFAEAKSTSKVLCSERAWVDGALVERSLAVLDDDEVKKSGIQKA